MADSPLSEVTPARGNDGTRPRVTPRAAVLVACVLVAVVVVGVTLGVRAASTTPRPVIPPAWTAPVGSTTLTPSDGAGEGTPQPRDGTVTPTAGTLQPSSPPATPYVGLSGLPMPRPTGSGATWPGQIPAAPRTCAAGDRVVGAAWTATVPAGWSCVGAPGGGELVLRGGTSLIVVGIDTHRSSDQACGALSGATGATPLPATTWGGRTAARATFRSGTLTGQLRCVDVAGGTYEMVGLPTGSNEPPVAAMDALATSWVWT